MPSLHILDQVAIPKGQTAQETLVHTTQLAQLAETLGYERYWFAEHHSTKGLASTAPEILMAHIAAHTSTLRTGSGGILLPQYSPFKVAEVTRQLEALYPGRIEIGVGKSPGGIEKTRLALTDGIDKGLSQFDRQLKDLLYYLSDSLPADHPHKGVTAAPLTSSQPPVWLLGLGENSAKQAAALGIHYIFGHFIHPGRGRQAFETYRSHFSPSSFAPQPQSMFAVFVICGETDEEANRIASSTDLWLLRVEKGLDSRVPSIDEAIHYHYTEQEKKKVKQNRQRMIVGSKQTVKEQLQILMDRYQTDDIMILNNTFDPLEKQRSFERIANLF
ncbi:LLM class flavin-dependent oxidoreductase [Bacillus sp. 179-C3.3 HS]|uniref:LLM class flavin-dependent oxidoreductase n=1 Tax=Bacillus sp. 179-C3.3 HS TaxID=3232162 RepID=UPI0039A10F29